jgi:membrane protease YdiL (CAAX protease family)
MNQQAIRNIGLFVFIVIVSGWIGVAADSYLPGQPQGDSLGMGIWLVLPLLTAFLIIMFSKTRWGDLGFKPNLKGNIKWYLASVLIFPVVTTIVLMIGAATDWMDLSGLDLKLVFWAFCSTLLINFIIDIFEETAWRGYLTSQLIKLDLDDWKLYLIVGCVWTAWHVPYYLVFLPEADIQSVMPVSRAVYVLVAFTTFLSWTVMFTELFRVTKSVWPCVILHAVEDSLINLLVISDYISIAAGKEILVSPINGVFASLLYLAVGLGIRAYRRQADQKIDMAGYIIDAKV